MLCALEDTRQASRAHPAVLEVIEDLPAGYVSQHHLQAGQAIRIMTARLFRTVPTRLCELKIPSTAKAGRS
jgi:hypothetical protein